MQTKIFNKNILHVDNFKKKIITLVIALMTVMSVSAQFSAGIKDCRYVYGTYKLKSGVKFLIEHSLYSEKLGFQRIGVGVGYGTSIPYGFDWHANAFGATTWNRNYQVVSADLTLGYHYRRIGLYATINPRYDSGLHYKTCWQAGASVKIIEPISFLMDYTTIPEYRVSERRVAAGFSFKGNSLSVTPKLSVSADKNTFLKNIRVLISMNYDF